MSYVLFVVNNLLTVLGKHTQQKYPGLVQFGSR